MATDNESIRERALRHLNGTATGEEQRLISAGWRAVPVQSFNGTRILYEQPNGGGVFDLQSALAVASLTEDEPNG